MPISCIVEMNICPRIVQGASAGLTECLYDLNETHITIDETNRTQNKKPDDKSENTKPEAKDKKAKRF